jgi:FlaA1/EpsC-like NDP-sugar epimerase
VLDVAERLRAVLGNEGGALAIQQVGRRPGERLAEELASANERLLPGPACGLLAVEHAASDAPLSAVPKYVAALQAALDRDDPALADQLMALARELQ